MNERTKDLARVRTLTRVLDELVRIPGTRFRIGLDGLIGLIPGAGDVVGGAAAAYALVAAARLGAPPSVIARMAGNILVDLLVGALPVVGDLFDFGWKANRRNLTLLERLAADPRGTHASSRAVVAAALTVVLAAIAGAAWLAVWVVQRLLAVL
jgi:Domain of unknown function (DUF4112)